MKSGIIFMETVHDNMQRIKRTKSFWRRIQRSFSKRGINGEISQGHFFDSSARNYYFGKNESVMMNQSLKKKAAKNAADMIRVILFLAVLVSLFWYFGGEVETLIGHVS